MVVDLYSVKRITGDSRRLGRQIESRSFTLDRNYMECLPKHIDNFLDSDVAQYLEEIRQLTLKRREYEHIGVAGQDNLWRLEMLGVGKYSAPYVTVIDFTDALDFALYMAFGCNRECRGWIDNYSSVSRQLMTYDFDGSSDKFDSVFHDARIAQTVYREIMQEVGSGVLSFNSSDEDKMTTIIFKFYAKLLESVALAKDYIACAFKSSCDDSAIYRSKTFATVILSTNVEVNDEVEIVCSSGARFKVPIRSYKRGEWMKEEIKNETCRSLTIR